MSRVQLSFLESSASLPQGFAYQADLISAEEEGRLLEGLADLDFTPFEFQGYVGKRRVISFGLHYDFDESAVRKAEEIPAFLLPLRDSAAGFARIAPSKLEHVLVTEYAPGAGIGWHKDRPVFQDVVGLSLLSPCTFRMRRRRGAGWERAAPIMEPRSVYLLRGPARTEWEHSISPGERLRYSITFRSLRSAGAGLSG